MVLFLENGHNTGKSKKGVLNLAKSKKKYNKNKKTIKVPGEDISLESSNKQTTVFNDEDTKNI